MNTSRPRDTGPGRCAVGRWASKGKAYIVVLRPVGHVLTMQQLRFASEVRPATEIDIAKTEVKPAEMKLARQLIDQQEVAAFDPTAYVDEVRGRIEAAIQKKVEGQEISISETPEPSTGKVIDRQTAAPLWQELQAICTKVGTAPPDQIIAGIDDNFYVTEMPVTVDGKTSFQGVGATSDRRTFKAKHTLDLTLGAPSQVQVTFNGQPVVPNRTGSIWHHTFTAPSTKQDQTTTAVGSPTTSSTG